MQIKSAFVIIVSNQKYVVVYMNHKHKNILNIFINVNNFIFQILESDIFIDFKIKILIALKILRKRHKNFQLYYSWMILLINSIKLFKSDIYVVENWLLYNL